MSFNVKAFLIAVIWAVTLLIPIVVSLVFPINKSNAWRARRPAFSPPAVVFPIAWTLLYIAAATALTLQIFWTSASTSPTVKWLALALVTSQLVIGFAWPAVWSKGQLKAGTYMILEMLAFLVPGTVLTAKVNTIAAALWSVMIVWLAFALLLSAATVERH